MNNDAVILSAVILSAVTILSLLTSFALAHIGDKLSRIIKLLEKR